MGQTLTHGIYLPDEGERNCYSGLAGNWQLLDGSVGTIAAHTAALAGKAPLVHTHTKADITDFPAYGNTAGTICEGNDSRLSDARTPVAHTHVTADVTDLLNSTHRWTTNQILKNTAITDHKTAPSADTGLVWIFSDNNNKYWGGIGHNYLTTGVSEMRIAMTNWSATGSQGYWHLAFGATKDFSNVYFSPSSNNAVNLGSSSNQWKSVYARSYYYNDVAWGLDQNNTWIGINTFQGTLQQKINNSALVKGTNPSSTTYYCAFRHQTYAGDEINLFRGYIGTTGDNCFRWSINPWVSGSSGRFQMRVSSDGSVRAFEVDGTEVSPYTNNATDLGTSTKRWKTLNGINPGALSLPDVSDSYDVVTTNWNTSFTQPNNLQINGANPSYPGWLFIRLDNCTAADDFLIVRYYAISQGNLTFFGSFIPASSSYVLTVPIQAGITTKVWVSKLPTYCKYYACLGTVK